MSTVQPDSARHRLASDPSAHVWVAASAGTGKTRALTDRVLRLLLKGAPPQSLFAITFTRTAAAEMQERVFNRLVEFAAADDKALDSMLLELGERPTPCLRDRARRLLLDVLDSPEGLEIRTIHGLAQALLAAFPMEAGLAPRAEPLDERQAAALRRQALAMALADPALEADLARLAVEAGESAIADRLAGLVRAGPGYAHLGAPGQVEPFLRALVGLPTGPTPQEIMERAVTPPAFDDAAVAAFAAAMESFGTEAKRSEAASARSWLEGAAAERVAEIKGLFATVRTKSGEPRKLDREIGREPALAEPVKRLVVATARIIDLQRALAFVDHAGAWLRLGMAVSRHYRKLKDALAAIDFDDMVALAADLVHADGMANAIAERLDREIRHILVDEAQDTNAAQWRLVEGLLSEFDAGEGQHGNRLRTRFVVGDFKQAIFRFQGTDPQVFLAMRERWRKATGKAGRPLHDVPLNLNFRSSPLILRLVDRVMEQMGPEAIGLPAGETLPPHQAERAHLPGRVMLFEPHVAQAAGDEEVPSAEGNGGEEDELADPSFADAVAGHVAALVREGSPERLIVTDRGGRSRPAGPGDILILLQARGDLMAALVRALHARGLPVAGVDRALLAEPVAVRDLLSLVRFVLQPGDDLALAEVLVSPLVGLDHEAIRKLRLPGQGLWPSLRQSADPALATAKEFLSSALARADFASPHAFLESVLANVGRAAFRARLGPEADDGIDALLAEALAFEADHAPTLQGFLAHVGASGEPIARDPDSSPGLVRLMTVHGAKGLEAPIVVLADALRPRKRNTSSVTWRSQHGSVELPLIFGGKDRLPAAIASLRDAEDRAEDAEHNRLLYVAMTRAQQLLLVAGQISPKEAARRQREPEAFLSWHDRIRAAMEKEGAFWKDSPPFGRHLRLDSGSWPRPDAAAPLPAAPLSIPAWATTQPPPEPQPPRVLTPSAPAPDDAPLPPPGPEQKAAAERGTRLHALFEHLPGLPAESRRAAATRLLRSLGEADPEPLVEEALAILEDSAFHDLFGPESLAEAPIAGVVDGVTVSGTVDRLLIAADRVLVVDLKTGLQVPARAEEAHPSHLRQMAAYRAVLRAAFPGRRVEAALLFTAAPRFLLLPDALLDRHWPPGKG